MALPAQVGPVMPCHASSAHTFLHTQHRKNSQETNELTIFKVKNFVLRITLLRLRYSNISQCYQITYDSTAVEVLRVLGQRSRPHFFRFCEPSWKGE